LHHHKGKGSGTLLIQAVPSLVLKLVFGKVNLPDNLPDEASPWGETGSASGVKWTIAVYEMTHLYAVSPDDV